MLVPCSAAASAASASVVTAFHALLWLLGTRLTRSKCEPNVGTHAAPSFRSSSFPSGWSCGCSPWAGLVSGSTLKPSAASRSKNCHSSGFRRRYASRILRQHQTQPVRPGRRAREAGEAGGCGQGVGAAEVGHGGEQQREEVRLVDHVAQQQAVARPAHTTTELISQRRSDAISLR